MNKVIYENNNYRVEITDDAIGEDGKYGRDGYALVNKETGFVEATSMLRANMLFLADQADAMLRQEDSDAAAIYPITEDIDPTVQ